MAVPSGLHMFCGIMQTKHGLLSREAILSKACQRIFEMDIPDPEMAADIRERALTLLKTLGFHENG